MIVISHGKIPVPECLVGHRIQCYCGADLEFEASDMIKRYKVGAVRFPPALSVDLAFPTHAYIGPPLNPKLESHTGHVDCPSCRCFTNFEVNVSKKTDDGSSRISL